MFNVIAGHAFGHLPCILLVLHVLIQGLLLRLKCFLTTRTNLCVPAVCVAVQPGVKYGTRSQTVIAVWRDGRVEQRERYIEKVGCPTAHASIVC